FCLHVGVPSAHLSFPVPPVFLRASVFVCASAFYLCICVSSAHLRLTGGLATTPADREHCGLPSELHSPCLRDGQRYRSGAGARRRSSCSGLYGMARVP